MQSALLNAHEGECATIQFSNPKDTRTCLTLCGPVVEFALRSAIGLKATLCRGSVPVPALFSRVALFPGENVK